jgi:predicted MFS family arabinose efflux permease
MSAAPPARAYAAWVLFVLLLVHILNFVDRNILAIVAGDIKREMELSDTELGILLGPAFATFFSLAGIPIARVADLSSRRMVIAAGLVFWSLMTAASGLSRTFWQIALARFGVAVGEAAGTPPSHSLISDTFPPERRATALAVYGIGIYFGMMFGFAGGGWVRDHFDWRTAFFLGGALGLPLALLLVATVREPARGEGHAGAAPPPLAEVLATLIELRSFRWLMAAACCQALLGYAVLSWGAQFLMRVHAMTATEVGATFGGIGGVAGALGITLGGNLADRLAARDARWYAWFSALVSLAAFPFAALFLLADSRVASLAAFAPFYFLNNMYVGSLWSLTQSLVAPRMRAVAAATQLAILNFAGLFVGPLVVGALNDALAPRLGDLAIRWSLLSMAAIGASAALFFRLCARSLREDLARADGDGVEPIKRIK